MDDASFGGWLGRRRRALRFSCAELARRVGCATITLRKIEADERRPSEQIAAKLAEHLRVEPYERPTLIKAARGELGVHWLSPPDQIANRPALSPAHRPLQREVTPFIGRVQELDALLRLTTQHDARLVTLVAPGGMGKSRLALAAAEYIRDAASFPNGVAFAALAPVAEPATLAPTLADALGLPLESDGRRTPRAQVLDYLRAKEILLVLDNCEHLREAVAELAGAILADAPGVTLLATSRERLGLRAEQLLHLDGMVNEVDGPTLFATTARAVQPAFALDALTRPQVMAICARVGGMPLAIELAAGWADTLSLAEIAAELDRGDELLVAQASDQPMRHHSVRAICDATWARMHHEEQAIFAQVAVFRGGGTRQALQSVTGASLGQLHTLIGKALLRYDPERERYAVHELLRRYAAERLEADSATKRRVQERHATYYLGTLAAREVALKGSGQREALDAIARESANVRAAWWWAAEAGAVDLLAAAVGALSLAYEWLGRSDDGLAAMRLAADAVAVARPLAPAAIHAVLLATQARFTMLRGDQVSALRLLTQAEAALDARGEAGAANDTARAQVLMQLGRCTANQDFMTAHEAFTQSLALCESLGDQWGAAMALGGLGTILINLHPSYDDARHYIEQSVSRYRILGDQIGLGEALTNLSTAARYLNHLSQSTEFAREAYALAQASGNPYLIALAASNLCAALMRTSATVEEADTAGRTALTLIQELGHQAELPSIYFRLGTVAFNRGRYAEARVTFTNGLAVARRLGDALGICCLLYGLAWDALAEGADQDALCLAEESIAVSVRLGEGFFRLQMIALSSLAARRLGDGARARADAVAALHFALATRTLDDSPLWAAALLLVDDGAPERAAEALALCEQMYLADNIPWLDIALRELRSIVALPPQAAAAARMRWAQRDYWAALKEMLTELEAAGWRKG